MPFKDKLVRQVYQRSYNVIRRITHPSVHLSIPREDYEVLTTRADELGLSLSQAILALAKAQADLTPPPIREETRQTLTTSMRLIRKTGNLINQWSRVYHQKSRLSEDDSRIHKERERYLYRLLKENERLIKGGLLPHDI